MASPYVQHSKSSRGFTLVEMVTVILILGILVVGVSSFIIFGTRIFVESSSVDQVLSQSRFAVERMTRELRSAMPSSVRLTTSPLSYQCIEFVPIDASTSYITMPIAPQAASISGTVILDSDASQIAKGQLAWIYPLTAADVYTSARQKRAQVANTDVLGNQITVTFSTNAQFAEGSPRQRIYFASQPVSYCFERQSATSTEFDLKRYSDYGWNDSQPSPADMTGGILMAQNIVNLLGNADFPLILTPATLVNNAMVHLQPRFKVNGETFQYQHQVQVINAP